MATAASPTLRRDLLLLALVGAILYLPALGRRDVWNPDEARYAEVAREMRQAGSWALPRLNGDVYTQKPPLFFWLVDAAALLTGGVDETAVRLPSALAGIGATLLVFLLGERLFSRRAAWIAAVAFATCHKIEWQARFGQIDMLLTFLVALQIWWFVRGYTEERPVFYRWMFVAGGLAILAKGPAGFLPPLLAVVAFLLWNGQRGELRRLAIGRGLLLALLPVVAWLVPAGLAGGGEYLQQIVLRQNVTRYAAPWHHHAPWYYYLTIVPPEFLPWSVLLPAGFVGAGALGGRVRDGFRLAVAWTVVTLVFFSLSPGKRDVYVLTLFPALALLVGSGVDRVATLWPARRRWVVAPLAGLAALVLLVVVALPVGARPRTPAIAALGGARFVWLATASLLPVLGGAALAWWWSRRGRLGPACAALGAGMGALQLLVAYLLLPPFDALKSDRHLAQTMVARMQPGDVYGIYPRLDNTILFYAGGRPAVDLDGGEEPLRAFLARPGRLWLLAQRDDWGRLPDRPPLVEVGRDLDPDHGYLLLARPEMVRDEAAVAQPMAAGARVKVPR